MRRWYALLSVAIVAVVGAIAWWKPWETGVVPVMTLARRAFGNRPVVHVLARDVSTPRPVAAADGIEIWYRGRRRSSHIVVRRGGKIVSDTLRKSIVPPIPSLPSTLWNFVTSYRSDLAAGRFMVANRELVEGRNVIWIGAENLGVAIDPTSYQPLWISDAPYPFGTELIHLVTAETIPYDPADFVLFRNRKPRHL